jgi:hypothetical protein
LNDMFETNSSDILVDDINWNQIVWYGIIVSHI